MAKALEQDGYETWLATSRVAPGSGEKTAQRF